MKKLLELIKKLLGLSNSSDDSSSSEKGFTLIELLIVIAVLGVLAAGILIAIDPVDRIRAANDSKVQNDLAALANANEAYAATHDGFYAASAAILVTAGELKSAPTAPTGYTTYVFTPLPAACTSGTSCTSFTITGQLRSKRWTGDGTPVQKYESSSGKNCQVATTASACP